MADGLESDVAKTYRRRAEQTMASETYLTSVHRWRVARGQVRRHTEAFSNSRMFADLRRTTNERTRGTSAEDAAFEP